VSRARLSGEERRGQILESAVAVFGRRGFEGTTTRALAREAGVSEAMIFRKVTRTLARYLARRMEDGALRPVPPLPAARAFLGMACHYATMPGRIPRTNAARLIASLFLNGLQEKKPA
jgi:AcrR family transcriptional regulator